MWTESLDRRQIIKRALNEETSIDPSEDASQMQLLLGHVEAALDGHDGAKVTVDGDGNPDRLTLSAFITLPPPLMPLQWFMRLEKAPQALFTTQFVLPTLNVCYSARFQVNSLLQHLKEKDHVINKLTDKLQADGTDLVRVFPGASTGKLGSKLSSRSVAAKSVKGLAEFDEDQWRHQVTTTDETKSDINELLSSVFASDLVNVHEICQKASSQACWELPDSHNSAEFDKGNDFQARIYGLQCRHIY